MIGASELGENKRIKQAQIGIAGEVKGKTAAASFGISGLSTNRNVETAYCGIAGPNTRPIIASANMGVAGNLGGGARAKAAGVLVDELKDRDSRLASISHQSNRLGDRATQTAWSKGVWFADFTYVCSPFAGENRGEMSWRKGRETVFGQNHRTLPFFIDSCGYRREITQTAPKWAYEFKRYIEAIELLCPDAYAAWDYPNNRKKTMDYLHKLMSIFPNDDRLWPIFSIRWTWNDNAHLDYAKIPNWGTSNLSSLIPLNETQLQLKESTRARYARVATAWKSSRNAGRFTEMAGATRL